MAELAIKGASGVGDSVYGYPIANYYSKDYDKIYYMSNYPELFEGIKNVECHRHTKLNYISLPEAESARKKHIDIRFSYAPRKHIPGTSQFEDSCISAGIQSRVELKIPWTVRNTALTRRVRESAKGRKVCIVAAPYQPFGRDDKWGDEIKIDPESIQRIMDDLREQFLFVLTGNKYCLYRPTCTEYDLIDQTSVTDLMDIISTADCCLSQIGNLLPMSEALEKKSVIIFSHKIPDMKHPFLRAITPEKTIHRKDLAYSVTDNNLDISKLFYDHLR